MDEELKQLAALALRNAFWQDFSALTNKYLEAAAGLDVAAQEALMGDMTSIYGRDTKAEADEPVNIWTRKVNGNTTGHATILKALEHEDAMAVYLGENEVFVRRGGDWVVAGA